MDLEVGTGRDVDILVIAGVGEGAEMGMSSSVRFCWEKREEIDGE